MIFVISYSGDVTTDFMCARLAHEGRAFLRLDTDTVAQRGRVHFQSGHFTLELDGHSLHPDQLHCVWLRRPRRIVVAGEDETEREHTSGEWAEALEGFLAEIREERWINHPARNAAAAHKLAQLARAQQVGLLTPETLLTHDADEARAFFENHHRKVVVKPLSGGYLERSTPEKDTQVYTSRVDASHLEKAHLLSRVPTLFQAEVDKYLDVRVCAVDGRLTAVGMSRRGADGRQLLDIRRDNMQGVEYRPMEMPVDVADRLRTFLKAYGLRFAAVDFAVDEQGRWVFFEVNPAGQWAWLDLAGVADVAGDLAWAMASQS